MDINNIKNKLTDEQAAQAAGGYDPSFDQTKTRLIELFDATEAALRNLYMYAGLSLEPLRDLFFTYQSYVNSARSMSDFTFSSRASQAFRSCASPFTSLQLRKDSVLSEVMDLLGILR